MPLGCWKLREQGAYLRPECGRGDRLRENSQARALGRDRPRISHGRGKIAPSTDASVEYHRLRTVRIPEIQDRSLAEDIRRAEASRVLRVSFDLGRPARVALDKDARGDSGLKQRRGVEERPAGKNLLGWADVRDDLLGGELRARAEPRQGSGSSHQLQDVAAIDLVVAFSRDGRKFVFTKFLGLGGA